MEALENLFEMTHDRLIFRGSVFQGVVIGEASTSGVVSGFDGGNPSGLDREARISVKVSD